MEFCRVDLGNHKYARLEKPPTAAPNIWIQEIFLHLANFLNFPEIRALRCAKKVNIASFYQTLLKRVHFSFYEALQLENSTKWREAYEFAEIGGCFYKSQAFLGHEHVISSLNKLPKKRFASSSWDGTIRIWKLNHHNTPHDIITIKSENDAVLPIQQLTPFTDTEWFLSINHNMLLWDSTHPNKEPKFVKGGITEVNCLTKNKSRQIFTGHLDNHIRVSDLSEDTLIKLDILQGHTHWVSCLYVTQDGFLLSGSSDFTMSLWNITTTPRTRLQLFTGHSELISCITECEDGTIITGSSDKTIRFWNRIGSCTRILAEHTAGVTCLLMLSREVLVSGSYDHTICIWNLAKHPPIIQRLHEHTAGISCLLKVSNSEFLSGSYDRTIRNWKVDTNLFKETIDLY